MINLVRFGLYLGLIAIPSELYYASLYAPQFAESTLYEQSIFYLIALGVIPFYGMVAFLLLLSPILFLLRKKSQSISFIVSGCVFFAFISLLAIDAHVFYLYRFHLSMAMLELFFNGQIISFSLTMKLAIAFEIFLLLLYTVLAVFFAYKFSKRKKGAFLLTLAPAFLLFLGVNLLNTAAAAFSNTAITSMAVRIPLYYPLSANTFLLKHGFISQEDMVSNKYDVKSNGLFDYPKKDLVYADNQSKLNILYIVVDSLRADMLNPNVMPNLYKFSKENLLYKEHYSGGNCTRFGIFTLFYGIPGSYWNVARAQGTPSAIVSACNKFKYDIKTFTSAPLYKPEFHQTVFSGIDNLRMTSTGATALDRDQNCIDDFEKYLNVRKKDTNFLGFVFLDSVHEYSFRKGQKVVFKPTRDSFNYLELNNDTDVEPYMNLARNASFAADENIGRLLKILKDNDLLDNTVVIITADHGDEINDNKLNYWGHNSNFSKAQTKIPLVLHYPSKSAEVINTLSTAYDVTPTLLKHVFKVENNISDFSIGQDLFNLKERAYFWASSYTENAVISKDRVAVFDVLGFMTLRDLSYRKVDSGSIDYWKVLQDLSVYLKK